MNLLVLYAVIFWYLFLSDGLKKPLQSVINRLIDASEVKLKKHHYQLATGFHGDRSIGCLALSVVFVSGLYIAQETVRPSFGIGTKVSTSWKRNITMIPDLIVEAIDHNVFTKYFSISAAELESLGAYLFVADKSPCYPCRVSLQDAEVGETVLAIPYEHHSVQGPYRSTGPVFIRKGEKTAHPEIDEIPKILRHRLLSVRAYNAEGSMVEGDAVAGEELEVVLEKQLLNSAVEYIHVHNAGPGCFNCEIKKA